MVGVTTSRGRGFGSFDSYLQNDAPLDLVIPSSETRKYNRSKLTTEENPALFGLEEALLELRKVISDYSGAAPGTSLMKSPEFERVNNHISELFSTVSTEESKDYRGVYKHLIKRAEETEKAFLRMEEDTGYSHRRSSRRGTYHPRVVSTSCRRPE